MSAQAGGGGDDPDGHVRQCHHAEDPVKLLQHDLGRADPCAQRLLGEQERELMIARA
jgi:hypothetical protein